MTNNNLASRLAALSPEKRKALLRQLQQDRGTTTTQQAIPPGEQPDTLFPRSLHAYFAQQVARTPEAIALIFGELHISYAELDRQSDQLAVALQARGVAPEVLVAVCLERSPLLVMALLAVLKAGGAYVPLDPAYPAERLAFMLQDAQVNLLLTHTSLRTNLPQTLPQVLYLDQEWPVQPDQHPAQYPGRQDQLAYVIYTSGSTGRPKGVMATHRTSLNRLTWMWRTYPFTSGEVSCQKTSTSFVDAVAEIFGPLLQGVPLVLIPNDALTDPSHLLALLENYAITRIVLVPSLLRVLLAAEELQARLHHLRIWVCSGEILPLDLAQLVHQLLPQARLFNFYGSSEVAADVTSYEFEPHHQYSLVPIGRPIANTQIYLLDADLQPVPIGIPGDLYVGGENLARGYLNQPALTAERFLVNPFAPLPGQRLYKTGDLARYLPDGTLAYLGRADQQVKIRGHRIEPREIEAVLKIHPAVRESVVLAREDKPGDTRLVAYLLAQSGALIPIGELRTLVREHLPEAMVPAAFVVLDAFPHTPNGKIDRRTFPAPEALQDVAEGTGLETKSSAAVRTPVEELLLGVWSQILGRPHLRIDDNFFDMGGHSLLVTQLIGLVRKLLAIEIPLRIVFEAPTVAAFAQQVERALRQKDALSMPPLLVGERPAALPLSFAQQRLWFLDQLDTGNPAYLLPSATLLKGVIKTRYLEQALRQLIDRHESLRTTFTAQSGLVVQTIQQTYTPSLPVIDLQSLSPTLQEQEIQRLGRQEAQCPCDLARGPLLRCTLLRLAPDEQVFLLTLHHIITDGWSMHILIRELTTLYLSAVAGQPTPLPPLPIQYADYTLWQRDWLQGQVLDAQMAYWQKHLSALPPLELPTDHPRPAVQTSRGASLSWHLSQELSEGLQTLSRQEHVTLFMTLLASFQVLLMRYSGQTDISVGTPIANRQQAEMENVIGFFVNTLVMRSDLSGNPPFVDLLRHIREVCLGAYAHQDVPFEQVVEALAPERDLSRSPLFQVLFILQNTPHTHQEDRGLHVHPLTIEHTVSKFELTLSITELPQGLHALMEYNTDLFEASTIQRLLGHWQTVLEGVVSRPQTRLGALPLLTPAERVQLLEEWTTPPRAAPRQAGIHQYFEQQVQRTPDAIALVFEELQVTYRELHRHCNHLAAKLHARGVGRETLVAVCLPRTPALVVALLAILKAGGAYLPLDPAAPADRMAFLLHDAQVALLLTQSSWRQRLPHKLPPVLFLDQEWSSLSSEKEFVPQVLVPNQLAYVIYTSGSTGRPKGVMATHQATLNRLSWMWHTYPYQPGEVACQKTNLSFVDAVSELFGPLLQGVPLLLIAEEVLADPPLLLTLLQRYAVTRIVLVPSLLRVLLASDQPLQVLLEHLTTWVCSGETLALDLAHQLQQALPQARLLNFYGSSEVAADVTAYEIAPGHGHSPLPIGRPIANTQIYLLDAERHPVPVGIPGEIYVGGENLARGYLGQAALTAERFVPHPFAPTPGSRLYQTGDLARYLPDGTIEFLGRVDQQVKIRGYRIELGEIEAVLQAHPAVQECVVLAREDRPGDTRLIAYIVAHPEVPLTSSEVRGALQRQLPGYMLPSAFVFVDTFPLTASGKIDRRALPAPEMSRNTEQQETEEARTPLEELLIGLWEKVIGRHPVSLSDNFFEIGGHSLLATQLIGQLRKIIAVEIPLRTLFEAPTVAAFAPHIERALRQEQGKSRPPLVAAQRPAQLPLSFAQQRLWFLDQLEPESPVYLVPSALRIQGRLEPVLLHHCLQTLVQRHESLRTTFPVQSGQPLQVIHTASHVPLPLIDLQNLQPEQREQEACLLAREEAQRPCDLARGPLLRCTLLRLAPDEQVLLLTLHHIITDGWSMQVLIRELTRLYQAAVAQQPVPLAPLPIQYADYALWQRDWLQGEILETQLNYWRTHLSQLTPLELPTDHPRPAVQSHRGASQIWQMPQELSEGLHALSRQEHVTLFMLLLASFQVLLMRYSGQDDISVGTPIANRQQAETEDVIGFFVNTLVMRTDLSGNPAFVDLLHRVREVCLDAYAHQDLPFEQVVEALVPERDLSRSPLFQVQFLLQNTPQGHVQDSTLQVHPLALEQTISKFDLTLSITQQPQGLHATMEYNTDLFEAQTIQRLLSHWENLLEQVVHDPQQTIDDVFLLSAQELKKILETWNTTSQDYPSHLCLHQLFEQQVQRTPDAIALVFEEHLLTYRELDQQANRLAHLLHRSNVGPEVLVGLFMHRSLAMIVGLLAVLKAGGAYLPLDPDLPAQRLAFFLQDAQVSVVLTEHGFDWPVPPSVTQVLVLAQLQEQLLTETLDAPTSAVTAENLAYVIYTSGSTGTPKGVMIPHRGVVHYVDWSSKHYAVADGTGSLVHSSLSFDLTITSLFPALAVGRRLVLAAAGIDALRQELTTYQGLSLLKITPAHLNVLEQVLPPDEFASVAHALIIGGEALHSESVARWRSHAPATRFINEYGPTETVVGCCIHEVRHEDDLAGSIPIGHPIPNTQIYLLDRHLHPVPIGTPGEVYIGGVGVGRGYLNRPELTAERFLANPFSHEPGARFYKTGDLARYLPDGTIKFLGRIDQQVKLRGYRIELGEIEAVLQQWPAIREAVVVLQDTPIGQRLVGYLVGIPEHPLLLDEVRSFLQERLPDYMHPSAWICLDTLPLTANGKLDRRALPAPTWEHAQDNESFIAPRTHIEKVLTAIWAEVLHTQHIGISENFFERGGDSILGIQIIARARQQHIPLTLKQLFQYQTIEQLSAVINEGAPVQAEQGPVQGSAPLTPIQHWFFDLDLADPHHWNQTLFLEVTTSLQWSFLQEGIAAWLIQHDALRLRFTSDADGWHQAFTPDEGPVPCLYVNLSGLSQKNQEALVTTLTEQAQASLDLTNGPLVRVVLFERGKGQTHLLLIVIHHLAVDGVSWRILLEDLQQAYQQRMHGQTIHLAAKTSSFKAWAEHLVAHASEIEAEQTYWLTRKWEQAHPLPHDNPLHAQNNTVASARVYLTQLTVQETNVLLEQVPAAYHTQINEILLTALAQALAPWVGSSCVLVDLEGHGREELFADIDLSRTVGWFTSIFPVGLDLGEAKSVSEAITVVKEQLRAIPNHGIGYGLLRYLSPDLRVRKELARLQPDISFNYLGQFNVIENSSFITGASPFSAGPSQSVRGKRTHLLNITAQVSGNQFQVAWSYSEHIHLRSTIEQLARAFMDALDEILSQSHAAIPYTPSDFSNVDLSQDQIDQIIMEMDDNDE